jgi:predicted AAA+ superfamily ATPase
MEALHARALAAEDPRSFLRLDKPPVIMETAVVTEITKAYLHAGDEPRLSFWRTARGWEVDIVVEDPLRLYPVEVKASATPMGLSCWPPRCSPRRPAARRWPAAAT